MANKILWYSIPALHDNTNGAAIHSKIMLETLVAHGYEVKVLNALVGDDVRGLEVFNRIGAQIGDNPQRKFLQFTDNGVEYFVAKTQGHTEPTIEVKDQNLVFDLFQQLLIKFQPDVVMGYSGDIFSTMVRSEAQARGIPVVYVLHNNYHRDFAFTACNLVVAPSHACAKFYHDNDGIDVKAIGQFIDVERIKAKQREAHPENIKYVTLINPTPTKGLAIFVKLNEVFAKKHPEIPFLVVHSVGNYQAILRKLHYADGTPLIKEEAPKANADETIQVVAAADSSADNPVHRIQIAEHTDAPHLIYDISRVVVTPSLCQESWGCVASEAVINGIPVVATTQGGLPEAINGGGILLPPPASTLKDPCCLPTDEEIAPWVEALERCLNEDWTERCHTASKAIDIEESFKRLMSYLQPLMDKGSKERNVFARSVYFSDYSMQRRKKQHEMQQQRQGAAHGARIPLHGQPKPGSKSSKKNRSSKKRR